VQKLCCLHSFHCLSTWKETLLKVSLNSSNKESWVYLSVIDWELSSLYTNLKLSLLYLHFIVISLHIPQQLKTYLLREVQWIICSVNLTVTLWLQYTVIWAHLSVMYAVISYLLMSNSLKLVFSSVYQAFSSFMKAVNAQSSCCILSMFRECLFIKLHSWFLSDIFLHL